MISTLSILVVISVAILLFKYFTGKGKPYEQRSGLEKLACGIFSILRTNTEDAARSVNNAKVLKAQALQEVTDALNRLDQAYKDGQVSMKMALRNLKDNILPGLKDQPGTLEAKARKYKNQYLESERAGHPIEAHKQNAIKALQHKAKALENIKRAEKNIEKLEIAIETAKADYDGNKMDLVMIKTDLESMVDIPQVELNESLARISSLQSELTNRMNEATIRNEVEADMRNESITTPDMDAEFNSL